MFEGQEPNLPNMGAQFLVQNRHRVYCDSTSSERESDLIIIILSNGRGRSSGQRDLIEPLTQIRVKVLGTFGGSCKTNQNKPLVSKRTASPNYLGTTEETGRKRDHENSISY